MTDGIPLIVAGPVLQYIANNRVTTLGYAVVWLAVSVWVVSTGHPGAFRRRHPILSALSIGALIACSFVASVHEGL